MSVFEGTFQASGLRFGIVASRFNDLVTRRLLDGARDGLRRHGVDDASVDVAWVPGAAEIPLAAKHMAETGRYAAVLTVGAVIRGATGHYDVVCSMVSTGVARASLDTGVPVVFGVLTTDTLEQQGGQQGLRGRHGGPGDGHAARVAGRGAMTRRPGDGAGGG
jgi:6,7-dimethyl-8-ribityllumazine synthase